MIQHNLSIKKRTTGVSAVGLVVRVVTCVCVEIAVDVEDAPNGVRNQNGVSSGVNTH